MIARRRIRYAVAGLGHIAQGAVLPAFRGASVNSELAALISDDPVKRETLGRRYGVPTASYADYERCLREQGIDAVYLAVPNPQHREFTQRALWAGVHVLCEKPIATTPEDAEAMLRIARQRNLRLMIAYRLHFEEANLEAVADLRAGRIGDPRVFTSTFTMSVAEGNIRLRADGGGPLFDIGIYCINAARYLFGAEPVEVCALSTTSGERRFREVHETLGAVLSFPEGRLATFAVSFGASSVSEYRVVGTKGDLALEPAYDYARPLRRRLTRKGRTTERAYPRRDQFAAELIRFSEALQTGREPQPSGEEGLADLRVMAAIQRSIGSSRAEAVAVAPPPRRPEPEKAMRVKAPRKPKPVHARSPRAE